MAEQAFTFPCDGSRLVGVITEPAGSGEGRGVLIVVGGPQYRVGSHRQFVHLARHLAARGFWAMRFDRRGMGDAEGELREFDEVGADLEAAVDALLERVPTLDEVVAWGLCDGASSLMIHLCDDARVTGLVLANPWVRSEETIAASYVKRYYLRRLVSPELWHKIARGDFDLRASAASFASMLGTTIGARLQRIGRGEPPPAGSSERFQDRMLAGLERYRGRVLCALSGDDLTAGEFRDWVAASRRWRAALARDTVTVRDLPEADHTFSSRAAREAVADLTVDWLRSW